MPSAINLPTDVAAKLRSYAQIYGIDPSVVQAVAQTESGGDQTAVSSKGAVGIMQLEPNTFNSLTPPSGVFQSTGQPYLTDIHDPNQNMEAGTVYLAQQVNTFGGQYPLALAAYNAGPGAVKKYGGVPPYSETTAYVSKVSALAVSAGSTNVSGQNTQKTINGTGDGVLLQGPGASYQPLANKSISQEQYEGLSPNVVVLKGLDEIPWFQDSGMVIGNRPIRSSVVPISFQIILTDNNGPFRLSTQGRGGQPIVLQLDASLQEVNIRMKHSYFKKPSRTGFHITLWGMQADVIEGQGTTGLMMNQLGVTDFMSVANASPELIKLVNSGFSHDSEELSTPQTGANGTFLASSPDVFTTTVQTQTSQSPSSFRVAAQDAFNELLSLFKMNGVVWFPGGDSKSELANQNQESAGAWSPTLGMTSTQAHGRNNDVMSRGAVVMTIEGVAYEGYFKSLSWKQDAKKPFQWEFSYVFQVERTSTLLYFPG